jgi:CRP/FNR family transcriptional regulator, cyclic AMP receptor protein
MKWLEIVGYVGAVLTFITFYMKAMLPLRYTALCSNIAFIVYGYFSHLYPVLFLHLLLLPLNIARLLELHALINRVRQDGNAPLPIELLLPFMEKRSFKAGDVLFQKGDTAHEIYYILDGIVHIKEIQMDIGRGQLAGVIGAFAPDRERPWSAVYKTDGEILALPNEMVMQLCHQNPQFGMSLARLITRRAITDIEIGRKLLT